MQYPAKRRSDSADSWRSFYQNRERIFDIIDEIIKKQLKLFMDNYGKSCAFR